jgi:hypothetical protein
VEGAAPACGTWCPSNGGLPFVCWSSALVHWRTYLGLPANRRPPCRLCVQPGGVQWHHRLLPRAEGATPILMQVLTSPLLSILTAGCWLQQTAEPAELDAQLQLNALEVPALCVPNWCMCILSNVSYSLAVAATLSVIVAASMSIVLRAAWTRTR